MKIGILTHPLRFNYGGILQNFALQTSLREMGFDVLTIDWNDDKSFLYMTLSYCKRLFFHYILGKKSIPTNFYINLTRKKFLSINEKNITFFEKNINRTEYISSIPQLAQINSMNFDAIVVGSDQVWLEQFVPTMFLDFLDQNKNIKRIAYAASFGKEEWTYSLKNTEIAKFYAKNFNAISVRETSAVLLCERYLKVPAEWVLDPTLLLTSEQYNKVIDPSEDFSPKKSYIMTYILDSSEKKHNIINNIAEKLGVDVFQVKVRKEDSPLKEKANSVSTWLSGFKKSKFVITDSFHGMVFAILYNKPFIAIGNSERGMARFLSLLGKLNLRNRLISENDEISVVLSKLDENIDYTTINKKLNEFRKSSIEFLEKSLKS